MDLRSRDTSGDAVIQRSTRRKRLGFVVPRVGLPTSLAFRREGVRRDRCSSDFFMDSLKTSSRGWSGASEPFLSKYGFEFEQGADLFGDDLLQFSAEKGNPHLDLA